MRTILVTVLAICGALMLFAAQGHSAEADSGYVWTDGFLEKEYPISMSVVDKAEFKMTQRWLSMQMTILDNGWMRLYGVGDEEGRYGQGKGGNVRMRFIAKNKELVSVGIKWGDGNKEASRKLHERFQEILAGLSDASSPQKEKTLTPQHDAGDAAASKPTLGKETDVKKQDPSPAAQAKDDKVDAVSLSYDRLPSFYQERDEKGILGPPAARVNYGDNTRKDVTVTATVGNTTNVCPLIYQDVAYVLDKQGNRGKRIPIFGYQGCPFTIDGPIDVTKDFEMREEITIEIERTSGKLLWVSSKSARPLASTGMSIATGCEMFINTTWSFKSKGMEFCADGQKFATEKDGATIKFTKTGVVMDGVSKK
jgi:hypothetical protein